jgi:DNA-directed RNA polymerase specialized sigma24 family protein
MKNQIDYTELTFEELIKNEDVIKIAKSSYAKHASAMYKIDPSKEYRKSIIYEAIWLAQKNYRPDKNSSFLTYVHNRVKYICLTNKRDYINKLKKAKVYSFYSKVADKFNDFAFYNDSQKDVFEAIESLNEKDRILMTEVYINQVAIPDIASQYNTTERKILYRIKNAIEKIRLRINN